MTPRTRTYALGRGGSALAAFAVFAVACAIAFPSAATAGTVAPPHVSTSADTDTCAMCHRGHTSFNDATAFKPTSDSPSRNALLVGSGGLGDTGLCFSCHGVDALGSGSDVESAFSTASGHSLEPSASAFGPSKQCSTCHDTHGAARNASGTPYAALLRTATATGTLVFSGDAVCGTCHGVRPGSAFPGLAVWQQTPHSRIPTAAGGTAIVCSACHDPHGSPVAPSLRTRLTTPSASVPATVTANDRTQCFGCHGASLGTWSGAATYPGSSHASSTATVTVAGEWVDAPMSRRVGECQACHAVMGATDASGSVVPDMLQAQGRALCDSCHDSSGPASTDFAALRYAPTTPGLEVIGAWGSAASAQYGRVQVFARIATAAAEPVGPREVAPVSAVGAAAAGDIDGDGVKELLVADAAAAQLALVERDAEAGGIGSRLLSVPGGSVVRLLAVADVEADPSGLPEVIVVTADDVLRVLRLSGGSLDAVGSLPLSRVPSAIAAGDIAAGVQSELVLTFEATDELSIYSAVTGTPVESGTYPTNDQPVAVAVADLDGDSAKREIAVASVSSAVPSETVSFFDGSGARYADGGGPLPAGTVPTAILAADILDGVTPAGTSGAEVALAYADSNGASGVRVIEQAAGGGFGSAVNHSTGTRTNAASLAFGDADGDGDKDLLVALAGAFTRTSTAVEPRIAVYTPNGSGTDVTPAFALTAGGAEVGGTAATVLVADLGAVGPSRHPVGAAVASHVSTESSPASRHVECADCHDSHLAKSGAADTAALPGELIGARGVAVENSTATTLTLTGPVRAAAEYEACFFCHSKWDPAAPARTRIASQVNTLGASYHPIEGSLDTSTNATGSTMTTAAAVGGTIRCGSCHGTSSASGPSGPHRSPDAPLLQRPYRGATSADSGMLCYRCHKESVYGTGADDGVAGDRSGFYASGSPGTPLHARHASFGVACEACHASHGVPQQEHLLRYWAGSGPFTWTPSGTGGSCTADCHTLPLVAKSYSR